VEECGMMTLFFQKKMLRSRIGHVRRGPDTLKFSQLRAAGLEQTQP